MAEQEWNRRVIIKASYHGLDTYWLTDSPGRYSPYTDTILDKLKVKLTLENDIDPEDIEFEFPWSIPPKHPSGNVRAGIIYDPDEEPPSLKWGAYGRR